MSELEPTDPRSRDGFHALEEKALAELERARGAAAGKSLGGATSAERAALVQVGTAAALTFAVLAVADRLDTLIDCAFDKRIPLRTAVAEDDQHVRDDHEEGGAA